MKNWKTWQKRSAIAASYLLVAVIGGLLTYFAFGLRPTKLDRMYRLIENRYIGEVDMDAVEEAAAYAMVEAVGDRWSYYIPEEEYDDYLNGKDNSYVGIGITIQARADGVGFDILATAEDGPAANAGVKPGDILIEVDGQSVAGWTTGQVSDKILGQKGTEVTVSVIRTGQKYSFTVKRAVLKLVVAEGQMLDGNIGYVRIHNFNTDCAKETIAAVETLVEAGAQALVFDVRNNPGGYVNEMIKVLDYLLPEGELFRSVRYTGVESVDKSDKNCVELPMAVLVNGNSYSAAEFFAAALMEYDWATVVGEPTVGKSYYQNTLSLGDGSALALSVGKYETPNGVSLAEVGGLTPDVLVKVDEDTWLQIYAGAIEPEDDPQVQAAVNALIP